MGRWRRKKHYYSNKENNSNINPSFSGSSIGNTNSNSKNNATEVTTIFTWREKKKLIQYLQDYKREAEKCVLLYYNDDDTNESSSTNRKIFQQKQLQLQLQEKEKQNQQPLYHPMKVFIGNKKFPSLTFDIVSKPYLELPTVLSSKERRLVHELCVDIGLYHTSVGKNRDDRYVIVSIYYDGFTYHKEFRKQQSEKELELKQNPLPSKTLLQRCKPWYCQNDKNEIETITQKYLTTINKLIDQPSKCLRSEYDIIDLNILQGQDLSDIEPPMIIDEDTANNNENGNNRQRWMLVDTPEKMDQCIQELNDANPSEIAFDLEAQNINKYTQRTCLLQITSSSSSSSDNRNGSLIGKEYIIDPLAEGVWEKINQLSKFFLDPKIVKIGHNIGSLDTRSLYRDFGLFVINAFDTYECAKILNLKHQGLNDVCIYYGLKKRIENRNKKNNIIYKDMEEDDNNKGENGQNDDGEEEGEFAYLKKIYQTTDWTIRPLTKPMIKYARYDIRYLIKIRQLMIRDLIIITRKNIISLNSKESAIIHDTIRKLEELEDNYYDCNNIDDDIFKDNNNNNNSYKDNNDGKGDSISAKVSQPMMNGGSNDNKDTDKSDDNNKEENFFTPPDTDGNVSVAHDDPDDDDEENFNDCNAYDDSNNKYKMKSDGNLSSSSSRSSASSSLQYVYHAKDLRMQSQLMKGISISLERSRALWTSSGYYNDATKANQNQQNQQQDHLKNNLLKGTLQRGIIKWTTSNMELYDHLCIFRDHIAKKEQCLPGFVCSLDFLVQIAAKQPTHEMSLLRITCDLPEILLSSPISTTTNTVYNETQINGDNDNNYQQQLLSLVLKHRNNVEAGLDDNDLYDDDYFCVKYSPEIQKQPEKQDRNRGIENPNNSKTNEDSRISWKQIVTVSAIAVAATSIVLLALSKRKRR